MPVRNHRGRGMVPGWQVHRLCQCRIDIPNQYEIFIINLDGSGQRRLTNGLSGIGGSISWSPDGTSLLISAGPVGGKEIYRLDAATAQPCSSTNGGNNAAPSWSFDGQSVHS